MRLKLPSYALPWQIIILPLSFVLFFGFFIFIKMMLTIIPAIVL